jgi:hypothetical protein
MTIDANLSTILSAQFGRLYHAIVRNCYINLYIMLSFSNKLTRILCITSYVIGIRQPKGRLYVQISSSRRHDVLFFSIWNPHQISNPGAATAQHWTVHHAWFVSHGTCGSPLLNTILTSGYWCGCVQAMGSWIIKSSRLYHCFTDDIQWTMIVSIWSLARSSY